MYYMKKLTAMIRIDGGYAEKRDEARLLLGFFFCSIINLIMAVN